MAYASQVKRSRTKGCNEGRVIVRFWEEVIWRLLDLKEGSQAGEPLAYSGRNKRFGSPDATGRSPEMFSEMGCRQGSNHVCASFRCRHVLKIQPLLRRDRSPLTLGCGGIRSPRWYTRSLAQTQIADSYAAQTVMIPMPASDASDVQCSSVYVR